MLRLLVSAAHVFAAFCERPSTYTQETSAGGLSHAAEGIEDANGKLDGSRRAGDVRVHQHQEATQNGQQPGALMDVSAPEIDALSYGNMDWLHDGAGPEKEKMKLMTGFEDTEKFSKVNYKGAHDKLAGAHWTTVQKNADDAIKNATSYKDKLASLARQMGTGQANARANGRDVSLKHETKSRTENITTPLNATGDFSGKPEGSVVFPPKDFDFKHTDFTDASIKVGSGTASTGSKSGGGQEPATKAKDKEPEDKTVEPSGQHKAQPCNPPVTETECKGVGKESPEACGNGEEDAGCDPATCCDKE